MSVSGGDLIIEGARTAEAIYREKSKVLDVGAIMLRIEVQCKDPYGLTYAPPLKVLINGVMMYDEMNTEEEKKLGNYNVITIWYNAKIRKGGIEPIEVELKPVEGDEELFKRARSSKQKYQPSYTKNQNEKLNREYYCPPRKGTYSYTDSYKPHRILLSINIKKPLFREIPRRLIAKYQVKQMK